MPPNQRFQHLPLLLRYQGGAILRGGGRTADQTNINRANFVAHADSLRGSASSASGSWQARQTAREQDNLPDLGKGIPVLLQVDPGLDLDDLRKHFGFEIVSEQEDGYVIVASEDLDLTALVDMINKYAGGVPRGSATIAKIHRLFDDPDQDERLKRILSESLYQAWPTIRDVDKYIVDVGIECLGPQEIPERPKRGKRDTDADWARKDNEWTTARIEAYEAWDAIKLDRENELDRFKTFYHGRIITVIDGESVDSGRLPDSFTVRIELPGKGLRDLVLNYPYIFEVIEPEDIELPQRVPKPEEMPLPDMTPLPPDEGAPAVCVIDSGIQEAHILLEPAIDKESSHCFLPGRLHSDIADYVRPGGHGTRVAGAVLYKETVVRSGEIPLEFWIQNARILDDDCRLPVELFPPAAIREVVERFHLGPKGTRIFNHSINVAAPCRTRHMSAWAAEMDALCEKYDVLIVQSSGNLFCSNPAPFCGLKEHLEADRPYPGYLSEPSCRVANPAQSLQALTVGSVAYGAFEDEEWRSFASEAGHPSAFSRSGFGIWDVIKPEVVEFGGDNLCTSNRPPDVDSPTVGRECYPELVRSTMYPPGPAADRDQVGTSYAAPKVSHIAAKIQETLPDESCLLYRALIVQSARWPEWALTDENASNGLNTLRWIGYGVPDLERATSNSPHRTTLIASRDRGGENELRIKARECHVFQVPIPPSMRGQADEFDILIEVTLSYAAQPRRTRRNLRRYLSTWVDWKSSKLGESMDSFKLRALKDEDDGGIHARGTPIPWMLDANPQWGSIRDIKRNAGTVQKDWAVVKSSQLPESFCIAVVGHPGWSKDPDSSAKYALAVSFEVVGREIEIYDDFRVAVDELQAEIEAEVEAEVEEEVNV